MTPRLSLQGKLVAMVALPIVATLGLWLTSRLSSQRTAEAYDRALAWSAHAVLAKEADRDATEYVSLVHRVIAHGDLAAQDFAEARALELRAAMTNLADLSEEFGPEEVEEDAKLRADVEALIAAASQEMAAAQAGKAAPGTSRVDALQSTVSAELLERVTEETAGSRLWQRRAEAAARTRARGEPVFALLSVLILLPVLAFARRLREGLRALTAAAGRVAARDAAVPVVLPREEELAEVISAFNSMAASVTQRTAELAGTNEQLEKTLAALTEAAAVKSRFLSTMSHEIRTPLGGVLGTLELLASGPLEPEQREYAAVCLKSAKALLALLNDVLDFSKFEARGVSLEATPFDPTKVVREVYDLFLVQAEREGVTLTLRSSPSSCWVLGDALRLRQVLGNLVGNAIKFSPKGHVQVGLECASSAATTEVCFTVEDDGIGISPKAQARLFTPFTQAEDSTHRYFGGTGLGLAISHRLVEAMGGALSVQSAVGQGTRFSFTLRLPLARPGAAPSTGALSKKHLAAVRGLKVLVVEDNAVNQLILSKTLSRLACQTSVAEDGQKALEALAREPFDVVLMDVQMPVKDGLQATREIRASAAPWAEVPILALTANAFPEDRQECLAAGMNGFLTKPLSVANLVPAILAVTGST